MKSPILMATVVAAITLWGAASGEGSPPETPVRPAAATGCCPGSQLSGCPDDYCRKPSPRIWSLPCGLPDDYCTKPGPRLCRPELCNLPDDYCRKPCPNLCRPICREPSTCGGPTPSCPALPVQRLAK